jgi:spore coat polysaccharide biosynthesis protein SpsF
MPHIETYIQTRMSSTRLPGKAMMEIGGTPLFHHVYFAARLFNPYIVMSKEEEDNSIASYCLDNNLNYFMADRPVEDVLGRLYDTAKRDCTNCPSYIIRLTSDCPMLRHGIIDDFVNRLGEKRYDTIYTNRPCDPDGFDIELFSYQLLHKAATQSTSSYDREHVTPWMYKNNDVQRIRCTSFPNTWKLSIDTMEDYLAIKHIMEGGSGIC